MAAPMIREKKFTLGWADHLCTTVIISLGTTHILKQINEASKWGGTIFLPVHAIAVYTIAIPLFILETAFGVITKKSFIKYWDMFPVFRGTGYCMIFNLFYNSTMHVCYAGMALILFINSFNIESENAHCKFKGATKDCIPITSTKIFNKTCCVHQKKCTVEVMFSSYQYYKTFNYANPENADVNSGDATTQPDWYIAMLFCWVVISCFSYVDIKRYYTIINFLVIFYGVLFIPVAILTIVLSRNMTVPSIFKTDVKKLQTAEFWVEVFVHATYWERPGEFIFLGSMGRESTDPTALALINYGIKISVLSIAALWMSIGVHKIKKYYNVVNVNCIQVTGRDVAFAVIPDLLMRWVSNQIILLVWYMLMAVWSLMFAVISVTANINTLAETHSTLMVHRPFLVGVYGIIGWILSCMLLDKRVAPYFQGWRKTGYFLLALTFHAVHIIAIGAYSLQRFRNDYTFYYGRTLHVIWRHVLKVSLVVVLVLYCIFLVKFYDMKIKKRKFTPKEEAVMVTVSLLFVSPLLIYIGVLLIHRRDKNTVFFTPTSEWGSPNPKKRRLRNTFFPQRTTKYDTEHILCPHSCLMYSKKLTLETEYLREKAYRLKDVYNDQKQERMLTKQLERLRRESLGNDSEKKDENSELTAEQMKMIKQTEEELAKYMLKGKRKIH